uniref:Glutathione S-transferase n=1 Tax=Anoplophora glabripennis TaxID=217634 RepID=V5H2P1_ANOGL
MVLKYYFDLLSQPSRSIYILLKLNDIPFEAHPVALREGEHLTEEFKEKLSKFQKVPFIHDGDFKLTESVGIARYLSREYPIKDHWYPKNSKRQAKIDEYLEWHHLGIRFHCSSYFIAKWVNPMLTGRQPKTAKLELLKNNMNDSLDKFEELFLSDGPFISGNEISFGDVQAACEIEQPSKCCGFK